MVDKTKTTICTTLVITSNTREIVQVQVIVLLKRLRQMDQKASENSSENNDNVD